MAREKSEVEYQNVTVRIPKEIYREYKEVLKVDGRIPTYDIRNHMLDVIKKGNIEFKEGEE